MSGIVVILWLGYAQNFILQPVSQIAAEISPVVLQSFCIEHIRDTIIGRYWISTFTCNRDSEI